MMVRQCVLAGHALQSEQALLIRDLFSLQCLWSSQCFAGKDQDNRRHYRFENQLSKLNINQP